LPQVSWICVMFAIYTFFYSFAFFLV
jgi:hypothetical protein